MDEQRKQIETPSNAVADYSSDINAMYDAQRERQIQSLENAYNQNVQTLQNSKANIAPVYNRQANDLSTQFERTRRNNNLRADMNGLNTGTASQMDLAQQSNYLSGYGQIRSAQAQAEQAVDQKIADLELGYKNAVAQAIADNDYQKASALLNEYKRRDEAAKEEQRYQYQISLAQQQYDDKMQRQAEQDAFARQQYNDQLSRQQSQDAFTREQYANTLARQQQQDQLAMQQYQDAYARQQAQDAFAREQYDNQLARQREQDALSQQQYQNQLDQYGNQQALNDAKTRAAYGDFSGYAQLYGPEVASSMQQFWAFSNPDYAYSMGLIDANQYAQATGYAPGANAATSYRSGSSSSGGEYTRSSNGNNVEGPGKIDSGTAAKTAGNGNYDFELQLAKHLDRNGTYANDKTIANASSQMLRELQMTANGQAQIEAAKLGLTPGGAGYNQYVSRRTQELLDTNPNYIAATNIHNGSAANVEAQRQADEAKAKRDALIYSTLTREEIEKEIMRQYGFTTPEQDAADKAQADGYERTQQLTEQVKAYEAAKAAQQRGKTLTGK